MNERYIQSVWIDWDKVDRYSYLRSIPALMFQGKLEFKKNITFL